jgi:TPR repeat protein
MRTAFGSRIPLTLGSTKMDNRSPETIYEEEPIERAKALLAPRAEAGDAEAQFYLGHLFDLDSPRRPDISLAWYRKAAGNGFAEARHWIASFLYHGMGTEPDIPAALELFRANALAGDNASQCTLGGHLLQFPESRSEGLHWLQKSAAQGNLIAEELLAEAKRSGT